MKFILATSLSLFALGSFAQEDLAQKKEKMTTHIDQKISRLQEHKTCVSNADSEEKLKQCKDTMKDKWKEMKQGMKEKKDKMMKKK